MFLCLLTNHLRSSIWLMSWRQPVTVNQVMFFSGKTAFCASGHMQLFQLCHVFQSDMLNVYHLPTHFFFCLSHPDMHQLKRLSELRQSLVHLQFPLADVIIPTDAMDSVPSNEACLYVPTNWSLAQAHHQFSLGLSQSLRSMGLLYLGLRSSHLLLWYLV